MCEVSYVLGWKRDPAVSENLKYLSVLKVCKAVIIRFGTWVLSTKSSSPYVYNRHRSMTHNLRMTLQQCFVFYLKYW